MQKFLDDFVKPVGVRFCQQVPDKECSGCKFSCCGHPLVPSFDDSDALSKLCIKDCLKMKVSMRHVKSSDDYVIRGSGF